MQLHCVHAHLQPCLHNFVQFTIVCNSKLCAIHNCALMYFELYTITHFCVLCAYLQLTIVQFTSAQITIVNCTQLLSFVLCAESQPLPFVPSPHWPRTPPSSYPTSKQCHMPCKHSLCKILPGTKPLEAKYYLWQILVDPNTPEAVAVVNESFPSWIEIDDEDDEGNFGMVTNGQVWRGGW